MADTDSSAPAAEMRPSTDADQQAPIEMRTPTTASASPDIAPDPMVDPSGATAWTDARNAAEPRGRDQSKWGQLYGNDMPGADAMQRKLPPPQSITAGSKAASDAIVGKETAKVPAAVLPPKEPTPRTFGQGLDRGRQFGQGLDQGRGFGDASPAGFGTKESIAARGKADPNAKFGASTDFIRNGGAWADPAQHRVNEQLRAVARQEAQMARQYGYRAPQGRNAWNRTRGRGGVSMGGRGGGAGMMEGPMQLEHGTPPDVSNLAGPDGKLNAEALTGMLVDVPPPGSPNYYKAVKYNEGVIASTMSMLRKQGMDAATEKRLSDEFAFNKDKYGDTYAQQKWHQDITEREVKAREQHQQAEEKRQEDVLWDARDKAAVENHERQMRVYMDTQKTAIDSIEKAQKGLADLGDKMATAAASLQASAKGTPEEATARAAMQSYQRMEAMWNGVLARSEAALSEQAPAAPHLPSASRPPREQPDQPADATKPTGSAKGTPLTDDTKRALLDTIEKLTPHGEGDDFAAFATAHNDVTSGKMSEERAKALIAAWAEAAAKHPTAAAIAPHIATLAEAAPIFRDRAFRERMQLENQGFISAPSDRARLDKQWQLQQGPKISPITLVGRHDDEFNAAHPSVPTAQSDAVGEDRGVGHQPAPTPDQKSDITFASPPTPTSTSGPIIDRGPRAQMPSGRIQLPAEALASNMMDAISLNPDELTDEQQEMAAKSIDSSGRPYPEAIRRMTPILDQYSKRLGVLDPRGWPKQRFMELLSGMRRRAIAGKWNQSDTTALAAIRAKIADLERTSD